MSARPDITATWLYRLTPDGAPEILLIRRSPGQAYPGIWQCVTGKLEAGERIVDGALREVAEEAGLGPADLEAFFETNQVNWFHVSHVDGILCEVVFAARLRPGATVTLSDEHDALQWLAPDAACELVPWPAYAEAIRFVEWLVADPSRAATFRVTLPG
jgi:8-oxo-dGTP pyrophosphatase MutT (NUDIX family)